MQDLGSRARAIKQAGATNLPYSEAILKECWWCPHAMRGTPWVSPVQNELSLHESTFSRTVWRLYGGAKGLVVWYYSPVQNQEAIRSAAHVVSGTETYLGFGRIASEKNY